MAGEGVILKSTGSSITLTYTSAAATADDYTGNLLEGVDAQTTISTSDYADKVIYTLANESNGFGLYHYTGTTLAANKAFLPLDEVAGARGFVFQGEEDTNGIESLTPDPSPKGEGSSYYTLDGRKLSGKPPPLGEEWGEAPFKIMKKQYTTPLMQVISITKPQLLAGSQLPVGGTTDTQMAPDFEVFYEEEF